MSKHTNYLQQYYDAIAIKDIDSAREALIKNAEACPNRNSYCLNSVFCPECPLSNGGLVVMSARQALGENESKMGPIKKVFIGLQRRFGHETT